jgi:hypothetical protein
MTSNNYQETPRVENTVARTITPYTSDTKQRYTYMPTNMQLSQVSSAAKAATYMFANIDEAATAGMSRDSDMKVLYELLKDRESTIHVLTMEKLAAQKSGKISTSLDAETRQKVLDYKLGVERQKRMDALRKVDIEIESLRSRRDDILSELSEIEQGILPGDNDCL